MVLSARVFNDWQTDQGDLSSIISVHALKSVGFFAIDLFFDSASGFKKESFSDGKH